MEIIEIYSTVSEKNKLEFLLEILQKSEKIKSKFIKKFSEKIVAINATDYDTFFKEVKVYYSIYIEKFNDLDLEDCDWEDYIPRHNGYIPEYEAVQHMAEDKVDEVFENYLLNMIDLLIAHDFSSLMASFLAMYCACKDCDIDDDYENLGDPNEFCLELYEQTLKKIFEKLQKVKYNTQIHTTLFENFFNYVKFNINQTNDLTHYLHDILEFLILKDKNSSEFTLKYFSENKEFSIIFPKLYLALSKQNDSIENWVKRSENLILTDESIAKNLLEYYNQNSKSDFIRVAKLVVEKYLYNLGDYIFKNISVNDDLEFFKEMGVSLTHRYRKSSYYNDVKEYISEETREDIYKSFRNDHDVYIELLTIDQRYQTLLEFAASDNTIFHILPKIVDILKDKYPVDCYQLLDNRIRIAVQKRYNYDAIVSIMKYAKSVFNSPSLNNLFMEMYAQKPMLPSLRGKMKNAGLVT